jgi:hypothetical protein
MTTSQTGMTFSELQTDIQNYLERGASSAVDPLVYQQIPRLITLAERRISADLKIEGFIQAVTTAFQTGVSVYPKPDRWRKTISINFGTGATNSIRTQLFPRSYEYIRNYWPDESQTDQPKFYADYNYNNWLIGPTPDQAYPAEILYYELPALLSDSNQTNWLTDYAPQLILYGSLLEATPFLKNDERIPVWKDFYQESLQAINGEDLSRIVDRTTARTEA